MACTTSFSPSDPMPMQPPDSFGPLLPNGQPVMPPHPLVGPPPMPNEQQSFQLAGTASQPLYPLPPPQRPMTLSAVLNAPPQPLPQPPMEPILDAPPPYSMGFYTSPMEPIKVSNAPPPPTLIQLPPRTPMEAIEAVGRNGPELLFVGALGGTSHRVRLYINKDFGYIEDKQYLPLYRWHGQRAEIDFAALSQVAQHGGDYIYVNDIIKWKHQSHPDQQQAMWQGQL